MTSWSKCPHCSGSGFEPKIKPKVWCCFCLPERHHSRLNINPRDLTKEWHLARSQRPGYVDEARLVTYSLWMDDQAKNAEQGGEW